MLVIWIFYFKKLIIWKRKKKSLWYAEQRERKRKLESAHIFNEMEFKFITFIEFLIMQKSSSMNKFYLKSMHFILVKCISLLNGIFIDLCESVLTIIMNIFLLSLQRFSEKFNIHVYLRSQTFN